MGYELLYVYIKDIGRGIKDVEFSFSTEYSVEYNRETKDLSIKKQETNMFEKFWGEKISSINLLIGKNGAGKTSILDLISMLNDDQVSMNKDIEKGGGWFVLYSTDKDDTFVVEGWNYNLLNLGDEFDGKKQEIRPHYSLKFTYNIDNGIEDIQKVWAGSDTEQAIEYYSFKRNGRVYKYGNSHHGYRNDQEDYTYTFERNCLESERLEAINKSWKYKFIIMLYESFCSEMWYYGLDSTNRKQILKAKEQIMGKHNIYDAEERITYLKEIAELFEGNIKSIDRGTDRYVQAIHDFSSELMQLDNDCFITSHEIRLESGKTIENLLKTYDKYCNSNSREPGNNLKDYIAIDFENISDGELEYIHTFADLYQIIDIIKEKEEAGIKKTKSIIICLDEPDKRLHPEWSRRYIDNLCRFFDEYELPHNDLRYQLIISTHSPFLVSDMPKEYVHCLDVDKEKCVKAKSIQSSFASNSFCTVII